MPYSSSPVRKCACQLKRLSRGIQRIQCFVIDLPGVNNATVAALFHAKTGEYLIEEDDWASRKKHYSNQEQNNILPNATQYGDGFKIILPLFRINQREIPADLNKPLHLQNRRHEVY